MPQNVRCQEVDDGFRSRRGGQAVRPGHQEQRRGEIHDGGPPRQGTNPYATKAVPVKARITGELRDKGKIRADLIEPAKRLEQIQRPAGVLLPHGRALL